MNQPSQSGCNSFEDRNDYHPSQKLPHKASNDTGDQAGKNQYDWVAEIFSHHFSI